MKNKLSVADIVVTVLIVLVACCGLALTAVRRVDKGTGAITMENYEDFLTVSCRLGSGWGGSPYEMEYDYKIVFKPAPYYELSNVTVRYALESEYSNLGNTTYRHTFTATFKHPETVTGKAKYCYPSDRPLTGIAGLQSEVKLTLLSVSGNYRYIGGEE